MANAEIIKNHHEFDVGLTKDKELSSLRKSIIDAQKANDSAKEKAAIDALLFALKPKKSVDPATNVVTYTIVMKNGDGDVTYEFPSMQIVKDFAKDYLCMSDALNICEKDKDVEVTRFMQSQQKKEKDVKDAVEGNNTNTNNTNANNTNANNTNANNTNANNTNANNTNANNTNANNTNANNTNVNNTNANNTNATNTNANNTNANNTNANNTNANNTGNTNANNTDNTNANNTNANNTNANNTGNTNANNTGNTNANNTPAPAPAPTNAPETTPTNEKLSEGEKVAKVAEIMESLKALEMQQKD
jgi:hypothetical protein